MVCKDGLAALTTHALRINRELKFLIEYIAYFLDAKAIQLLRGLRFSSLPTKSWTFQPVF